MKEGEWLRSGGGSWCVPNAVFGPDQAIEPVAYSRDPPAEFDDGRADQASDCSVLPRSVTIAVGYAARLNFSHCLLVTLYSKRFYTIPRTIPCDLALNRFLVESPAFLRRLLPEARRSLE